MSGIGVALREAEGRVEARIVRRRCGRRRGRSSRGDAATGDAKQIAAQVETGANALAPMDLLDGFGTP